jgi:hypothetical protein
MYQHDSLASTSSTANHVSRSSPPLPTSPPVSNEQSTGITVERPVVPPLSCMRHSPRPCVNQALVDALKPLRDYRFAQFGCESIILCVVKAQNSQQSVRVVAGAPESISYSTALAAIIATPFPISSGEEAKRINKVSPSKRSLETILLSSASIDRRSGRR